MIWLTGWRDLKRRERREGEAAALALRIVEAEQNVVQRRQEFLAKRMERRQVEAIVERAGEEEAAEAGRRAQREMDDWFLSRTR